MTERTKESDGNLAAKRLGDLLLKGYRMLDAACPNCNTVLMQSKEGTNICVLCKGSNPGRRDSREIVAKSVERMDQNTPKEGNTITQRAIVTLLNEIEQAANQLESQTFISGLLNNRQDLINHIQICANTIKSLKTLQD